jgi:hypothetical protein
MDGKLDETAGTITSLDGTRTITLEEFDRLFDEGSDEIDAFIDWSKGRRSGGALHVPVGRPSAEKTGGRSTKAPKDADQ